MNDIFLPNFIDLWTNLRNKFFFNFNKCYNCLRIRRISIGEKTRQLEVLARYWSPTSRETVNSPNKKERERERVGGPLLRFERRLLSALLHARIHLVARRVSKSVVSLNYSWRVFFSATADHRPPSIQGEQRGGGGFSLRRLRDEYETHVAGCRWKISAIIGRPLIIHLSPANRARVPSSFVDFEFAPMPFPLRVFLFNPSIKFRTERTNSIVHVEIRNRDCVENIWIREYLFDK